jgi:hypothetical protein
MIPPATIMRFQPKSHCGQTPSYACECTSWMSWPLNLVVGLLQLIQQHPHHLCIEPHCGYFVRYTRSLLAHCIGSTNYSFSPPAKRLSRRNTIHCLLRLSIHLQFLLFLLSFSSPLIGSPLHSANGAKK